MLGRGWAELGWGITVQGGEGKSGKGVGLGEAAGRRAEWAGQGSAGESKVGGSGWEGIWWSWGRAGDVQGGVGQSGTWCGWGFAGWGWVEPG